ncbi:DUF1206 domain-containing protein [Telluribacter sp. SYSU D00476]|uniref:DUF1206 domain-containing protein n=1 Tax=Telluribacter sp. SYSU D00476 TaxID=2811430 RepID=UPI001FF4C657|nr:DUF1206 domain-containing protein [Telluribacter sp. SYSU D00476]
MAYTTLNTPSKDQWIEGAARAGLTAKGIVYTLVGILTFTTAFKMSNANVEGGKSQIFQWIQDQPFGQILLGITTVGLLCYTVWRLIEAIKDTEHKGSDAKGLSRRATYLSSAVVYGSLTFYAAKMLLGSGGNSGGGGGDDTRQTVAQKLLEQPMGQWLVGLVAVGTMAIGAYQIYRAMSDKYRKNIEESRLDNNIKQTMIEAGKLGYIARGIVWLIIGYLFLQAAIESDSSEAGGTTSAFKFLENEYGSWILGIIAIGLVCYGMFMFVRARYEPISTR